MSISFRTLFSHRPTIHICEFKIPQIPFPFEFELIDQMTIRRLFVTELPLIRGKVGQTAEWQLSNCWQLTVWQILANLANGNLMTNILRIAIQPIGVLPFISTLPVALRHQLRYITFEVSRQKVLHVTVITGKARLLIDHKLLDLILNWKVTQIRQQYLKW